MRAIDTGLVGLYIGLRLIALASAQCPTTTAGVDPRVLSACSVLSAEISSQLATGAQSAGATLQLTFVPTSVPVSSTVIGPTSNPTTVGILTSGATSSPAPTAGAAAAGAGVGSVARTGSNHHYRNHVVIPAAVVCSILGALLIALLIWFCCFRRRRKARSSDHASEKAVLSPDSPDLHDEKRFAGSPVLPGPLNASNDAALAGAGLGAAGLGAGAFAASGTGAAPGPSSEPIAPIAPIASTAPRYELPSESGAGGPRPSDSSIDSGHFGATTATATAVPFMAAGIPKDQNAIRPSNELRPSIANSPRRPSQDPGRPSLEGVTAPWQAQPLKHFRRRQSRDGSRTPPAERALQVPESAPAESVLQGPAPTAFAPESVNTFSGAPTFAPAAGAAALAPLITKRQSSDYTRGAAPSPAPTGPLPPIPTAQQPYTQQMSSQEPATQQPESSDPRFMQPPGGISANTLAVPGAPPIVYDLEPSLEDTSNTRTRPPINRELSTLDEASVEDSASFRSDGRGGHSGLNSAVGSISGRESGVSRNLGNDAYATIPENSQVPPSSSNPTDTTNLAPAGPATQSRPRSSGLWSGASGTSGMSDESSNILYSDHQPSTPPNTNDAATGIAASDMYPSPDRRSREQARTGHVESGYGQVMEGQWSGVVPLGGHAGAVDTTGPSATPTTVSAAPSVEGAEDIVDRKAGLREPQSEVASLAWAGDSRRPSEEMLGRYDGNEGNAAAEATAAPQRSASGATLGENGKRQSIPRKPVPAIVPGSDVGPPSGPPPAAEQVIASGDGDGAGTSSGGPGWGHEHLI